MRLPSTAFDPRARSPMFLFLLQNLSVSDSSFTGRTACRRSFEWFRKLENPSVYIASRLLTTSQLCGGGRSAPPASSKFVILVLVPAFELSPSVSPVTCFSLLTTIPPLFVLFMYTIRSPTVSPVRLFLHGFYAPNVTFLFVIFALDLTKMKLLVVSRACPQVQTLPSDARYELPSSFSV